MEKPSLEVAKEYLATEEYLWNSGMFIWKVSSILKNIKKFMPAMYKGLEQIQSAIGTDGQQVVLEQEFNKMESQSIDYGIMERAKDIYILPGAFGWDDVGSWLVGQKYYPIHYDLKSIGKYLFLALVLYGIAVSVPIENMLLRLGFRTILLFIYLIYLIRHDLPLNQIPYLNKLIFKKQK